MIPWARRLLPRNAAGSLSTSSASQQAEDHHRQLEAYRYFLPIQTRWQDNDQYGHVNNAVYYSYFDTIINHYLLSTQNALLDSEDITPRTPENSSERNPALNSKPTMSFISCLRVDATKPCAEEMGCLHRSTVRFAGQK
ncbi:uncharacterized protein LOC691083 isoform X3 [Rattus norvegicus]|uniref:uncharacterized protein LOC691083 isoform X3 n=1 Tax=Rattus norvegicus TaxID=10116 RepID=UPI0000DA224D